tara:strand:+ start:1936 stop:2442 length:507 start_codon:yes stop_codon:yes gene_type:complete
MISLTGINSINNINLTGYQNKESNTEPFYIKNLKKVIFDLYIIPLKNNNWTVINENIFAYDNIFNKLNKYYNLYPSEDLNMYLIILKTIFELNGEYNHFNTKYKTKYDGLAKFEQYIPTIKLAPPYELYKLILGKPKNNIYDDFIISKINTLLKKENISFNEIKKNII